MADSLLSPDVFVAGDFIPLDPSLATIVMSLNIFFALVIAVVIILLDPATNGVVFSMDLCLSLFWLTSGDCKSVSEGWPWGSVAFVDVEIYMWDEVSWRDLLKELKPEEVPVVLGNVRQQEHQVLPY